MQQVTIYRDKAGNLHIFKGHNVILETSRYLANRADNGMEADLFVQHDTDIMAIREGLNSDNGLDNLDNGYAINWQIDSLYFNH